MGTKQYFDPEVDDLNDPERQARFLRNLASVYSDAYAAALAIVGNRNDAEDVIQEVCVVLWEKFGEFEPGTSFRKWACSISYLVAKNFVRKKRRRSFGMSDYAMSRIEQVRTGTPELMELRSELLVECVEKLSERDREFLDRCYCGGHSIAEIARSQQAKVETIYTRLKRLRKRLSDCMNRTLGKGG